MKNEHWLYRLIGVTGIVFASTGQKTLTVVYDNIKIYIDGVLIDPRDANGKQIPTEIVGYPNNIRNFVQTGVTSTNSISVSNNNERINYRVGITNMSNRGIIPGSDLFRNNSIIGC